MVAALVTLGLGVGGPASSAMTLPSVPTGVSAPRPQEWSLGTQLPGLFSSLPGALGCADCPASGWPVCFPFARPCTQPGTKPGPPTDGRTLVWSDEFSAPLVPGARWMADRTSAYEFGNHNPKDDKLDWLDPSAVGVADGIATFTARPGTHTLESGRRAWDTGLLTTEGSTEGFQVRTGDYVETRVQMPTGLGAWPALWTWKGSGNEVDSFEYHPDHPAMLELASRVGSTHRYHTDPAAVAPGRWVTIGTRYGRDSVDWYLNGVRVHSDRKGVTPSWSAYLILNLSVEAGRYHPAPPTGTPIEFKVDYVKVWR
ncbi:beta-glucanase [Kitasatospora sp. NPDC088346]|uniref:glycoside hydrolase family 16 protein n=1 Tax=Kitasatospora sp. NPDC088346 TaxID=3364073 RepID=UPI0037F30A09